MDEVLAAEEYKLERSSKSYPKRKLLPRLEEEAYKPSSPAHNTADRPPRGCDREASRPSTRTVPRHRSKSTKPRGTRRTCGIYWRTRQDNPDLSMDHLGSPRPTTTTVAPDTATPVGPNKIDQAPLSSVVISPSTEAPHTHYASQMK